MKYTVTRTQTVTVVAVDEQDALDRATDVFYGKWDHDLATEEWEVGPA